MPYGYRGLKIFTSLSLRFQDFQRGNTDDINNNDLQLIKVTLNPGIAHIILLHYETTSFLS
jgi:hypothetical protein